MLFALNGAYLLNEKGAVGGVDGLAGRPAEVGAPVAAAYRALGLGNAEAALDVIAALVGETEALAG